MRPTLLLRSAVLALALASASSLVACRKSSADSVTAESATPDNTVTEKHDAGTVGWAVSPDGKVRASIKPAGSDAVDPSATGTVTAKPAGGSASGPVKLEFDKSAGLYTATIPKLEADVTEFDYEITLKGKTLKGTLHLPKGGTDELIATGKTASSKIPKDKKGPNGGTIQVVGGDIIEIAADKSGEVRVYVLDNDMKPIAIGKRRIKLAVGTEIVELTPDAKGYFVGKLSVKVNPSKLTVVFYEENATTPVVVLCGWAPGNVIVVNHPTVNLFVVNTWTTVVVNQPTTTTVVVHKGKGHGKGHHKH